MSYAAARSTPNALRVLETSDLQSLRDARHLQLKARLKHNPEQDDFSSLFAPGQRTSS